MKKHKKTGSSAASGGEKPVWGQTIAENAAALPLFWGWVIHYAKIPDIVFCEFPKCSCWGVPAPNPAGNECDKLEFVLQFLLEDYFFFCSVFFHKSVFQEKHNSRVVNGNIIIENGNPVVFRHGTQQIQCLAPIAVFSVFRIDHHVGDLMLYFGIVVIRDLPQRIDRLYFLDICNTACPHDK